MDSGNAESIHFKHFDVVPVAEDHHFLHHNKSHKDRKCFNNGNAPVHAKIMKEWRILENSLPESIYVQAYETRIDLLRAVIIGSAGTPYHDGLFFFDIVLPSEYPNQPPQLYHHSHGYRLNHNLYVNGTVCLSLINTTGGSIAEKWTKGSTILQILVSIQGLVLNERPYFNIPSYKHGETSKLSSWIYANIGHNEDVFVLSCKNMIQIIRQPPKNFENFVLQHFRGRAASILAAIEHYQKGLALVGQFQMNAASSSSPFGVSSIFKANLIEIHLQLSVAFSSVISDQDKDFSSIVSDPDEDFSNIISDPPDKDFSSIISDPKASQSTTKTAKEVKKGRHNEDKSGIVKSQKNAKHHRKGLLHKSISFAVNIWGGLLHKSISFAVKIWKGLLNKNMSFLWKLITNS